MNIFFILKPKNKKTPYLNNKIGNVKAETPTKLYMKKWLTFEPIFFKILLLSMSLSSK